MDDHWTDYLTHEESVKLDDIQLRILQLKDKITVLRILERQMLEKGTSRKRRAANAERKAK